MPDLSLTTFNGQTPPLSIPALDTNFSKIKTYIQTLIGTSGAVSGAGGALVTLGFTSPILDRTAPGAIGGTTPSAVGATTITSTGGAVVSSAATTAYEGQVTAGASKWNLYMGGTANNYLAGQLLIGSATQLFSSLPGIQTFANAAADTGAVFINGTASGYASMHWNSATAGDNIFTQFRTEGGSGTTRGSIDYNRAGVVTRYNTTSDYRSKEVLGPVLQPIERVMALRPVRARMHGATMDIDTFVAHEFQTVIPEGVSGEKDQVDEKGDPIMQGLDKTTAIPLLVAAVQALAQQVADLQAQLGARQP